MEDLSPQEQHSLEQKVNKIYEVLVGDEYGNKGFIFTTEQRLKDAEDKIEKQQRFIEKILISFSAVLFIGGIFGWIATQIINYFHHKN